MRRLAIWLLVIGLTAPGSAALGAEETPTELPESGVAFGDYQLVPLGPDGTYAGPPLPADLEGIPQADLVAQEVDPAALAALTRNGFVVVPDDMARFHMAYESQVYEGRPVFVTTDAAYDTWHLVFDKLLRDLEEQVLLPRLQRLAQGHARASRGAREGSRGHRSRPPRLARSQTSCGWSGRCCGRTSGASATRLGPSSSSSAITPATSSRPSSGTFIDYSLYAPRGHYTLTPKLRRYFQAMSVLGQTAFLLPGSRQIDESVVEDPSGLRLALLASRTLVGDPKLERLWQEVYEPSSFLVGVGDDYTPFELAAAVEATVPEGMADPALVADDANLEAVAAALRASREVQIDSERPSVRLMGTRFVIDSWVLDQLIWPNVGTEDDHRKWPSPLDLAAAFGSEVAYSIQDAAGETAYANYPEQMAAMRTVLDARPDEAWGGTVYDAWLAALEPMWLPHGEAFPEFMRTPAWDVKAQQTGLGSYSELRHDTILYVKQAVGELGDAGPPEVVVRHWVEPDPVPFQRLAAVATLTRDGLAARGLLDEQSDRPPGRLRADGRAVRPPRLR